MMIGVVFCEWSDSVSSGNGLFPPRFQTTDAAGRSSLNRIIIDPAQNCVKNR